MSKELRRVFEPVKGEDQQIGAMEAVKEGIQAIAPGLSLRKIFADVVQEGKDQLAHGAHEMASALFRGDAFVMYPRTNQDKGAEHGVSQETQQHELDRGGREM